MVFRLHVLHSWLFFEAKYSCMYMEIVISYQTSVGLRSFDHALCTPAMVPGGRSSVARCEFRRAAPLLDKSVGLCWIIRNLLGWRSSRIFRHHRRQVVLSWSTSMGFYIRTTVSDATVPFQIWRGCASMLWRSKHNEACLSLSWSMLLSRCIMADWLHGSISESQPHSISTIRRIPARWVECEFSSFAISSNICWCGWACGLYVDHDSHDTEPFWVIHSNLTWAHWFLEFLGLWIQSAWSHPPFDHWTTIDRGSALYECAAQYALSTVLVNVFLRLIVVYWTNGGWDQADCSYLVEPSLTRSM